MELSQRKLFIARFEEFAEENRLGDFMICDLRGRMCGILFRGHPCRESVLGARHRKSSVLPQSIPFPPLCPSVP